MKLDKGYAEVYCRLRISTKVERTRMLGANSKDVILRQDQVSVMQFTRILYLENVP